MDIVLGIVMAPSAVRMVLMEGENADGVTVDQDDFGIDAHGGDASDRVVSAILGTRESAREGGYRLSSTGVVVADQIQAGLLRDALAGRRVRNVTLVSAFLAAAALAQAVGGAVGYARTALLFVRPDSATLAVVDSADGAITEVHRVILPADDDQAMTELLSLAAGADRLASGPNGMFVVGSGVNIGMIKPKLEAATRLAVSAPEEPELALARGAALASAHTPLLDSSTSALAWARDPGSGVIDPDLAALGYVHVSDVPADYDATAAERVLAYSAVGGDDPGSAYLLPLADGEMPAGEGDAQVAAAAHRRHRPVLLAGSALAALVVAGVATLVIALAVGVRPMAARQPVPVPHVVVPAQQAPAPAPNMEQPAPPPSAPPAPPPSAEPAPPPAQPAPPPAQPAPPPVQVPVPAARQVPAPVPAAPPPAPAPVAPAPAPPPVAPIPIPIPIRLPALIPALVPAPAAPAPKPVTPPTAPKAPAPTLPPIFNPPTQGPPKAGGGSPGSTGGERGGWPSWPGIGGNQRGGSPSSPGSGGGQRGGSPGWPGNGGGRGGGLFPGFGGGGHGGGFPGLGGGGGARGGHGGFGF